MAMHARAQRRHKFNRFAVCMALAIPAAAHSQVAEQSTAVQISTLPEVKVTAEQETASGPVTGYRAKRVMGATKSDTSLAETPQSVTVVTRDQMIDQGATNLQDALNYAAGVRSDAYGLDSRTDSMLIRGGYPDVYIDGMRQSSEYYTSGSRPDPYALERIEVLRGPSAMLYGQGSTGGILNLVSKRPQAERQGEIGVQVGNYGRKQVQADFTGPLTEDGQWLYRVVGLVRDSETQVDYVGDDRALLAPSLTWKPNGVTSLTLQASYQRDRTGSTSQFLPWAGMITPNVNGMIPTSRFIGEPTDRYDTDRQTLGYLFEHQFNDSWTLRQNFRYAVNKVDYFSHYADSFSKDPSTGLPGGWAIDPVNQRLINRYVDNSITKTRIATIDQHLQGKLQTGAVHHEMLIGLDYTRYQRDRQSGGGMDTIDVYAPVYGNGGVATLTKEPRFAQRQIGVYAQDQMKLGQNWIVVAGLRHDKATNSQEGSVTEQASATTKRLGVMYANEGGWSPYLSYSESFTPQGNREQQSFKPLRGEQWEAGVKYEPAGSRLAFNAAVYSLKENNQIIAVQPNVFNQLGGTKSHGVELEAKGAVTSSVDLILNYNYTKLDEQLEPIPEHQASAWGKWRFAIGDVTGLSLGAGVRLFSSFGGKIAPKIPSLSLFDAMLAWDTRDWRYALNVNNLTDKTYVATCLDRGDCWYGARRSIIASATYKF